jgi:branched-chain amino acid transport system ATP-binding protein
VTTLLEVRDLDLYYGDAQALDRVSLKVHRGSIVAIVGANGAGKSSLIRAIAGIEAARAGEIYFSGHAIRGLDTYRICDLGIGQVAEGRQLFPTLTTLENLEMGALVPRARARTKEKFAEVFALFPRLFERKKQLAGTLSGGEQQMLAIGRCLMACPELIMLDEPSLGLAPVVVQDMMRAIHKLNQQGITILLVEQNVALSLKLAQQAYVLENGRVVLAGSGSELLNDERMRRAYLGL